MSTTFAPTPDERLAEQCDKTADGMLSFTAWQEHHDVFAWLLPLKNRVQKPIETAQTINNFLDEVNDHAETFIRKQLGIQWSGDTVSNKILRLFRVTIYDDNSAPIRYRNPRYKYYEERTQPVQLENRHEHYQKWRTIPTVDASWFDHHWGITGKNSTDWIRRHYGSYREQRRRNKIRLARSLATYKAWTNYSLRELCSHLPVNYQTVRDRVRRRCLHDEWQPPERPCNKGWFVAGKH